MVDSGRVDGDSERMDGGQREGGWLTARGWMVDSERMDG